MPHPSASMSGSPSRSGGTTGRRQRSRCGSSWRERATTCVSTPTRLRPEGREGSGVGVLEGYRVLDLSIAMSGPFAAMRLGDLGADVIKVEPVTGEWQRHVSAGGARGHRVNVSFLSLNRNKRSLAVNLKDAEGRRLVHELARTADVFLQNYRPGVAARLGMDYETIRDLNPRIVYISISGYGETGPYASRPGQDLILQGMSGAMFSAGRQTGQPQPSPMY